MVKEDPIQNIASLPPSPTFLIKGGHQVDFINDTSENILAPHAASYPQYAQITDPLGIRNKAPIKFEHLLPLSFEALARKGASAEWCKYNMHLLNSSTSILARWD